VTYLRGRTPADGGMRATLSRANEGLQGGADLPAPLTFTESRPAARRTSTP
jgi:hypothetical protein